MATSVSAAGLVGRPAGADFLRAQAAAARNGSRASARLRVAGSARSDEPGVRRHTPHAAEELCETGRKLYLHALHEYRIPGESVAGAPCLVESGLLYPDADDPAWLRPTPPVVALPRLLEDIEARVARQRSRAAQLASAFEPFLTLADAHTPDVAESQVTVLKGVTRIRRAVAQAMSDAAREVLGIQPSDSRPGLLPHNEPWRMAEFAARGGQMRTLSRPQTTRDTLPGRSYPDRPPVVCEVRTLDQLPHCLLIFDRDVAFIPAADGGGITFEVRSPALISYLSTAFDVLWRLATPTYGDDTPSPPAHAVSQAQRAIARLLTEGHNDSEIARLLGMNIRTVRLHVAKLAGLLGSGSRTQLGYLIGRSGLLDPLR
ncbi:helix-turn-helix transcriptional regulator [Streptomyces lasiicapitis]|uniref:helix-turn-helix transcriptional regulator n=1 Tax=Streptomyces lasiicapitis TaxID=1923961 RepID=UPI00364E75A6